MVGSIAKGMPDWIGCVSIKGLCISGSVESAPEWKDFIKIAGSGILAGDDFADIQFVVLFGIVFGLLSPKDNHERRA
jgi:hypothetical protein